MIDLQVMMRTGEKKTLAGTEADSLQAGLRGTLLRRGDTHYDEVRRVWNRMIDRYPALIAICQGVADVMHCVRFADAHNLLVSVRGGGHNVAGNAVCDEGLMIDLAQMNSVVVDPVNRRARAEPGATWGDFDHETQAFGLATPGGIVSSTGIAGLTLGGGAGWLLGAYGLSCDNLLSANVVTADGQLVTASATENADLFWGLRGGGGNFGIVTSFEFQLYPVANVLGGSVFYPIDTAREALAFYREFTRTVPDALTSTATLMVLPDIGPVCAISICYHGSITDGERAIQALRTFGSPLFDDIQPMSYVALQTMLDAAYPPGLLSYWKSSYLKEISNEAIDNIVSQFDDAPSPLTTVVVEHMLGAMRRVPLDATAFHHRNVDYNLLIVSGWQDPAENLANIEWTQKLWDTVQPFSTGSVYVNYLGDEGLDRLKAAYGPEKYQRLAALKNKYDPTNMFCLNQNIKPTHGIALDGRTTRPQESLE